MHSFQIEIDNTCVISILFENYEWGLFEFSLWIEFSLIFAKYRCGSWLIKGNNSFSMVESSSSQPPSFSCSNGAQKSNLDKYSSMSSIYDDQVCDFKLSCLKNSEIFKIFCKILEFEIDNTYKRTYPGKLPFKNAMFRQNIKNSMFIYLFISMYI